MIVETAVEFKVEGMRERLANLERWVARAAQQGRGEHEVEGHLFREMLETILGLRQSVDTLERGNRQMAEAAPAFRQSQPVPKPEDEGALLVATLFRDPDRPREKPPAARQKRYWTALTGRTLQPIGASTVGEKNPSRIVDSLSETW